MRFRSYSAVSPFSVPPFFTALGDGLTSALIAFLRTLVFESASVIILPLLLGLNGIWGAIIVAECMSVTVSVIFLVVKRKRYQYFRCSGFITGWMV